MLRIQRGDDSLRSFIGTDIPSEGVPDAGVVVAMTAAGGVIEGRSSEPLSDELSLGA